MEFLVFKSCKGDILIAGGSASGVKGAVNLRRTNVHDRSEKHTCAGRYRSLQVFSPSGGNMIVPSVKEYDTPEKGNDFKTFKTGGIVSGYSYLAPTGSFQPLIRIPNYQILKFKTMLKKVKLILIIVTTPLILIRAQTTVKYNYDNAGNRTYRGVITLPVQQYGESKAMETTLASVEDKLGNQKVVIYPNPTKGELIVEIDGYDQAPGTEASVFSMKGKRLQTKTFTSSSVNLDLTGYPMGTYILKIKTRSTQGEWKVVKE